MSDVAGRLGESRHVISANDARLSVISPSNSHNTPTKAASSSLAYTTAERFRMAALVSWFNLPDANYCPRMKYPWLCWAQILEFSFCSGRYSNKPLCSVQVWLLWHSGDRWQSQRKTLTGCRIGQKKAFLQHSVLLFSMCWYIQTN